MLTIQTTIEAPAQMVGHPGYRIAYQIFDDAGKTVTVASAAAPLASENPMIEVQTTVAHPLLWSLESPHLYKLHAELLHGQQVVDSDDTTFGIRTIRFDADTGFYLNGKPVKIKGTCNHQDFAGVGIAVPDSLEYWRVANLKAMGSNGWRTSHNAPTESLLDACDKEGMLVMDENRHLGDTEDAKSSGNTPYSDLSELTTMILRDRNHPSIIMWSMCNEEFGIQATVHGAKVFAAMRDRVLQYDTTRPITCAMNGGYESAVGITSVEDLQGINYNPGAYTWFHKAHPAMAIFGSETASTVSTRGVYATDKFSNSPGHFRRRRSEWLGQRL